MVPKHASAPISKGIGVRLAMTAISPMRGTGYVPVRATSAELRTGLTNGFSAVTRAGLSNGIRGAFLGKE